MMSKVYVVQNPVKIYRENGTQYRKPSFNLRPAEKFGELHIMLPEDSSLLVTAPLTGILKKELKDFTEDDYLLPTGDPVAGMIAAAIVGTRVPQLNILRWDRNLGDYIVVTANIKV